MEFMKDFFTINILSLRNFRLFPFHLYLINGQGTEVKRFYPANFPIFGPDWVELKAQLNHGYKLSVKNDQHETYIRFTKWIEEFGSQNPEDENKKQEIRYYQGPIPVAPRIGTWNHQRVEVPDLAITPEPSFISKIPILGTLLEVTLKLNSKRSKDIEENPDRVKEKPRKDQARDDFDSEEESHDKKTKKELKTISQTGKKDSSPDLPPSYEDDLNPSDGKAPPLMESKKADTKSAPNYETENEDSQAEKSEEEINNHNQESQPGEDTQENIDHEQNPNDKMDEEINEDQEQESKNKKLRKNDSETQGARTKKQNQETLDQKSDETEEEPESTSSENLVNENRKKADSQETTESDGKNGKDKNQNTDSSSETQNNQNESRQEDSNENVGKNKKNEKKNKDEMPNSTEIPQIPLNLPVDAPALENFSGETDEQLVLLKEAIESENFLPLILSIFKEIRSLNNASPLLKKTQAMAVEVLNQDNLFNRIYALSHLLSKQLNIRGTQDLLDVFLIAQTHHLGLLEFSSKLLSTPLMELNAQERSELQKHPTKSINILRYLEFQVPEKMAKSISYHHDKGDPFMVIGSHEKCLGQIIGVSSAFFYYSMGLSTGAKRTTKEAIELINQGEVVGLDNIFTPQVWEKFVSLINGNEIKEMTTKQAA